MTHWQTLTIRSIRYIKYSGQLSSLANLNLENFVNAQNKIKEIKEMIEVVLLRIPKEIEARNFYLSAATRTTSPTAKELFESLSEQERGHEAELRRVLGDLQRELLEIKGT